MTDLQKKLLELLCEIDVICKKHDITYALFAGTALGADRHKGFIPWDDDADIIMTYENYIRFLEVAPNEMKEGRTLNALELNTREYPFTYARYVNINTCAIQRHTTFGDCDPGVKVDIFYVVPTYDDLIEAEKHKMEIIAFSEVICNYGVMISYRPDGFLNYYKKEKRMQRYLGRKRYVKKRMKELILPDNVGTKYYALFSGMMSNSYILKREILDNIKYVEFESVKLPISMHNIEFSRVMYGDEWINKPNNIDKSRHTMLLDMDRPYKRYIESLWNTLDYNTTKKIVLKRKQMHLKNRDYYNDVHMNNQRIKNLVVEIGVTKDYYNTNDEDDYNAFFNIFKPYYDTQLQSINKCYNLCVELEHSIFYKAMDVAIMTGNYYIAADIIRNVIASNYVSKDKLEQTELIKKIDVIAELTEAIYMRNDWKKVNDIINTIDGDLRNSLSVLTAECWVAVSESKDEMKLNKTIDMIDSYMQVYDYKAELMYLKGCALEKLGKRIAAENVYRESAKKIKNGFVYQELLDKGYTHDN